MPSRRTALLGVIGMACCSAIGSACSELSYVGRAKVAYEEGRYLEVAESLAARERELDELPAWKKARYGLYRGLSLMQLGDPEEGRRWLHYARDVELREATLDEEQRQALSRGLSELNTP